MTIKQWSVKATEQLQAAGIPSARLDAELILCSILGKDRAWLIAHDDFELPTISSGGAALPPATAAEAGEIADKLLIRRLKREPLAYILGYKEFYGRQFQVTPDVLIPRPDSEVMIELLAGLLGSANLSDEDSAFPISGRQDHSTLASPGSEADELAGPTTLIDVGTGSGAIAITAKLEFPSLNVCASDVSPEAIKVAKRNTKNLGAEVSFYESNLLDNINGNFNVITANLPYVDETWQTSPETRYEPDLALFAANGGLRLIERLLPQAASRQLNGNLLLLEADPRQHDAIIALARQHGYDWHQSQEFIVVLEKS